MAQFRVFSYFFSERFVVPSLCGAAAAAQAQRAAVAPLTKHPGGVGVGHFTRAAERGRALPQLLQVIGARRAPSAVRRVDGRTKGSRDSTAGTAGPANQRAGSSSCQWAKTVPGQPPPHRKPVVVIEVATTAAALARAGPLRRRGNGKADRSSCGIVLAGAGVVRRGRRCSTVAALPLSPRPWLRPGCRVTP